MNNNIQVRDQTNKFIRLNNKNWNKKHKLKKTKPNKPFNQNVQDRPRPIESQFMSEK